MAKPPGRDDEGEVRTRKKSDVKKPSMYRVLLHNDDYTSMEFVVAIVQTVFHHSESSATRIMLHIHNHGVGVAGVFTAEIAETKVRNVMELAREAEFPLLCTMEPE